MKNYLLSAIAITFTLLIFACSKDSVGSHINYNKVTTGRMDLSGAVAVGLMTESGKTRAIDGNLESAGLYKIDANGNITAVGLFLSEDEDGNIYEHQEPLRVVPQYIHDATDNYFIAGDCEYFDKDDYKVDVSYEYLLVRKSDGKIWGIDHVVHIGINLTLGRYLQKYGNLYYCDGFYCEGYREEKGKVYRFNLNTDIPTFEQITKDNETFVNTYHIADNDVIFSNHIDSSHNSELHLSWPNAGWQRMSGLDSETSSVLSKYNSWEIKVPTELLIDLFNEPTQSEVAEFKLTRKHALGQGRFLTVNNHPVYFPSFGAGWLDLYYKVEGEEKFRWVGEYQDKNAEMYLRAESYAESYIKEHSPAIYVDILFDETPLSASFGNIHELTDDISMLRGVLPNAMSAFECDGYTLVSFSYNKYYDKDTEIYVMTKIDKNGEWKFLKETKANFADYNVRDPAYHKCYMDSGKLWRCDKSGAAWFDIETFDEGYLKFSTDVPESAEFNKVKNGKAIFVSKNSFTGNTEHIYVDLKTGNVVTEEISPKMVFETLVNLN